ncbi:hypothetical protein CSUI_000972, partial [Cystoisospora suis]
RFRILAMIGESAVRLDLPPRLTMHPVFLVSSLRHVNDWPLHIVPPPSDTDPIRRGACGKTGSASIICISV